MKEGIREEFMRCYANLPIGVRDEVIAMIEPEGPVTWMVAYLEIKNHTPKGDEILESLETTKIF